MSKLELRCLYSSELRAVAGHKLTGYAAIFNQLSEVLGNFRERIKPGAFTRTLREGADVRCLMNHDPNLVLGRTTSGTLQLEQDSKGLKYTVDLPDTTAGHDLYTSVKRGDISQSSFGFTCVADAWPQRDVRELLDVNLLDVSPVTYPAYKQTAVSARSSDGKQSEIGWYRGQAQSIAVSDTEDEKQRLYLMLELSKRLR